MVNGERRGLLLPKPNVEGHHEGKADQGAPGAEMGMLGKMGVGDEVLDYHEYHPPGGEGKQPRLGGGDIGG